MNRTLYHHCCTDTDIKIDFRCDPRRTWPHQPARARKSENKNEIQMKIEFTVSVSGTETTKANEANGVNVWRTVSRSICRWVPLIWFCCISLDDRQKRSNELCIKIRIRVHDIPALPLCSFYFSSFSSTFRGYPFGNGGNHLLAPKVCVAKQFVYFISAGIVIIATLIRFVFFISCVDQTPLLVRWNGFVTEMMELHHVCIQKNSKPMTRAYAVRQPQSTGQTASVLIVSEMNLGMKYFEDPTWKRNRILLMFICWS